jgi:hypothetical protein
MRGPAVCLHVAAASHAYARVISPPPAVDARLVTPASRNTVARGNRAVPGFGLRLFEFPSPLLSPTRELRRVRGAEQSVSCALCVYGLCGP